MKELLRRGIHKCEEINRRIIRENEDFSHNGIE